MAGFNGRELTIDWSATTLVGVQSRGISNTNALVDVTTDDDNGWRTLLATPGLKSVDVTVSGVASDEVLLAEFYNASVTGETLQVSLPSSLATPGNVSGTFMLASFNQEANHDGSYNFEAQFQSSGVVAYTASTA
jgi:TP901-1 family phage major tail protein